MEQTCRKSSSALIIIDAQNEFLSTNGNFPIADICRPGLVANLKALIPRFRQEIGHVIWVKGEYEHRSEEPARMREQPKGDGIVANNEWLTLATHVHPTPCCAAETFGSEFYPEVFALSEPEDMVITKGWYSAFHEGTALLRALQESNVSEVYFCGVASGTCVLASVVDAVKLGDLQVNVVPDCLGWRRHNTHIEALRRFDELGVNVLHSDQIHPTLDTSAHL